jgi:hypothetical protein
MHITANYTSKKSVDITIYKYITSSPHSHAGPLTTMSATFSDAAVLTAGALSREPVSPSSFLLYTALLPLTPVSCLPVMMTELRAPMRHCVSKATSSAVAPSMWQCSGGRPSAGKGCGLSVVIASACRASRAAALETSAVGTCKQG